MDSAGESSARHSESEALLTKACERSEASQCDFVLVCAQKLGPEN